MRSRSRSAEKRMRTLQGSSSLLSLRWAVVGAGVLFLLLFMTRKMNINPFSCEHELAQSTVGEGADLLADAKELVKEVVVKKKRVKVSLSKQVTTDVDAVESALWSEMSNAKIRSYFRFSKSSTGRQSRRRRERRRRRQSCCCTA